MEKDIEKRLKDKLEQEKKRLTKDLKFFAKKDPKIKGNWRTKFPSLGVSRSLEDSASEEVEEYAKLLPIEHTLETRLKDIDSALEKIKQGKYGKCENCGEDIKIERMLVNPEANICIKCSK
ncbi:MAG: TraR/DksA C4-type zinc finger protein [bacterium]